MPELLHPAVYVQEITAAVESIEHLHFDACVAAAGAQARGLR